MYISIYINGMKKLEFKPLFLVLSWCRLNISLQALRKFPLMITELVVPFWNWYKREKILNSLLLHSKSISCIYESPIFNHVSLLLQTLWVPLLLCFYTVVLSHFLAAVLSVLSLSIAKIFFLPASQLSCLFLQTLRLSSCSPYYSDSHSTTENSKTNYRLAKAKWRKCWAKGCITSHLCLGTKVVICCYCLVNTTGSSGIIFPECICGISLHSSVIYWLVIYWYNSEKCGYWAIKKYKQ